MSYELIVYRVESLSPSLGRLVEKIWHHKTRALIIATSQEEAQVIDQLLWTYTPLSFLPHGCEGQDTDPMNHFFWITTDQTHNANKSEVAILIDSAEITQEMRDQFSKIMVVLHHGEKTDFLTHLCHTAQKVSFWRQKGPKWISIPHMDEI